MNTYLNYIIEVFPVADERDQFTIDNTTFNSASDKYMLVDFNLVYSLLNPERTSAQIVLFDIAADTNADNQSTVGYDIKRGDIIQIKEETETSIKVIFLGYIQNVMTHFSAESQFITLICPSPLMQFTKQYAIRPMQNAESYTTSNFTQWIIFQQTTIKEMMDIFTAGTVLQLAHDKAITGNEVYKFVNATGTLAGKFSLNSDCWAWIQPTTSKLEAINTIIYPYQYQMWIDQYGTLIMSPLSTRNEADPVYDFTVTRDVINSNDDFISAAGKKTPCISIDTSQSLTANRYVTTLINAGVEDQNLISVQDLSGTGRPSSQNNVQTAQQIFSRQQDLLLTGYYANQLFDAHSLNDEILTNPVFLNMYVKQSNPYVLSTNSAAGQIKTTTGASLVNGVLQLFGGRALASSLAEDTVLLVTSERGYSAGKEFPLGKMIKIDTAGRLDEPGIDSFLCTGINLMYRENDVGGWDATLSLAAIKPYTHIFLWDE